MKITLKDVMTKNFRFLIKDEFRLELFRKAIAKERLIKNLSKENVIVVSRRIRSGKRFSNLWSLRNRKV